MSSDKPDLPNFTKEKRIEDWDEEDFKQFNDILRQALGCSCSESETSSDSPSSSCEEPEEPETAAYGKYDYDRNKLLDTSKEKVDFQIMDKNPHREVELVTRSDHEKAVDEVVEKRVEAARKDERQKILDKIQQLIQSIENKSSKYFDEKNAAVNPQAIEQIKNFKQDLEELRDEVSGE